MIRELFSFHGRLSRGEYAAISIVTYILMAIIRTFVALGGYSTFQLVDTGSDTTQALAVFGVEILLSLPLWWVYFAAAVKRLHDQDKTGWLSLLLIIPVVGFFVWIFLFLVPEGTRGRNRYDAGGAQQTEQIAQAFE